MQSMHEANQSQVAKEWNDLLTKHSLRCCFVTLLGTDLSVSINLLQVSYHWKYMC